MTAQTSSSPLRFRVPAQDTLPNPLLKIRARELRSWINALPWANVPSVIPPLLEAIASLNRIDLVYANRFALLQLYEPALSQVRSYQTHLHLQTQHPSKTDLKLDARVRRICRELAYGYKISVIHATRDKMPWGKNKVLPAALCHAMKYLALDLLYGYQHYNTSPGFAWIELHQLYTIAQARGIETLAVPNPAHSNYSDTIEHIYQRILLLDRLDPYHLARGEAVLIYHFLRHNAELTEIKKEPMLLQQGRFLVDLQSESGAQFHQTEKVKFDAARHRCVNVNALIGQIEKDLAALQQGDIPSLLEKASHLVNLEQMFRYMLRVWRMKPQRRLHRQADNNKIEFICSVEAIYHFLGGENPKQTPVQAISTDYQEETVIQAASPHVTLTHAPKRHSLFYCHKINQSSGGIALSFALTPQPALYVGQLLAFRTSKNKKDWRVGAVRWVRVHQNHLAAGMQVLSQQTSTATLEVEAKDPSVTLQPVLMPLNATTGLPNQQLLTSAGLFQAGRRLTLHHKGVSQTIRADRLLESTTGFERFCYKICKQGE